MGKKSCIKTEIIYKIKEGKILDAIQILKDTFSKSKDFSIADRTDRIRDTYTYLLKYLKEGVPDPQRSKVLSDIREEICNLAEETERKSKIEDSSELFYTRARLAEFSGLNFSEALGRFLSADAAQQLCDKSSDEYRNCITAKNISLQDIFSIIWTMSPLKSNIDIESIINVATDSDISFSLRAVIVSALIMGLLNNYDRTKFVALLSIESRTSDEKIRARALIGIALILDTYPKRISSDPRIAERFETMADDLTFYTRMREVIYSLVKARGGLNYLKKIKNEIIPDIKNFGPDFVNKIKNADGNIDIELLEENPEWEKMLEKTGLEKKLRRLNNMQSNGADMMLSMFEQASNNFFYNDIDSWFRPFSLWEAERLGVPEEMNPLIEMFSINEAICDSDKFAMVSNLSRLPESARNLLRSTFEAQAKELTEEFKSMTLHTSTPEFDMECYNYARVLFRFFSFFRLRSEFRNPFKKALSFDEWPIIGNMFAEKEILSSVGEFYYRQGFMEDAISLFRSLMNAGDTDEWKAFCLQKIGCAMHNAGKSHEALDILTEAFTLAPEDEWLARKIVSISKKVNTYPVESRDALLMLYRKDKDNLDYLLPLARFEVNGWNYLSPDGKKAKFLERAAYIAPENPEVIYLFIAKELRNDTSKENVTKMLKMLRPSIDVAEMYLASLSLNASIADSVGNIENGAKSNQEKDEIRDTDVEEMSCTLMISSYLNFLVNNQKETIRDLKNLKIISNAPLDRDSQLQKLSQILLGIEISSDYKHLLPLMIESLEID